MSEIFNNRGQLGPIDVSIEATQYDMLKNLVQQRVEDPVLIEEYIAAFIQVAKNLNVTISEFVELLTKQGTQTEQDIFLAGYLNQTRVANAKIGVTLNLNTPLHVRREIRA